MAVRPPWRYERGMKTPQAIGLAVIAVAATVAIEETRMARLKADLAAVAEAKPVATHASGSAAGNLEPVETAGEAPVRTKRERPEAAPAAAEEEPGDAGSMVKTVRKMWDNPAGKAMMNQGARFAVAMLYEDFIKTLALTPEEADYFKGLLGNEISAQQELGMKMMGASPEERKELASQIEAKRKENDEAIRQFLNSDEDYAAFTGYRDRAPERQQLEGLRATLHAKGITLESGTETKLVEAMYRARADSGTPDYSGPNAFAELSKNDIEATFEENWRKQDEILMKEVSGFLGENEIAAVREFRGQMKEMQMMGLRMVRKMMGGGEGKE